MCFFCICTHLVCTDSALSLHWVWALSLKAFLHNVSQKLDIWHYQVQAESSIFAQCIMKTSAEPALSLRWAFTLLRTVLQKTCFFSRWACAESALSLRWAFLCTEPRMFFTSFFVFRDSFIISEHSFYNLFEQCSWTVSEWTRRTACSLIKKSRYIRMYIYIYIYTCIYVCTCVYIYIYI